MHAHNYGPPKVFLINVASVLPIGFCPQELSASDRGKLQEAMAQVEVTNFVAIFVGCLGWRKKLLMDLGMENVMKLQLGNN